MGVFSERRCVLSHPRVQYGAMKNRFALPSPQAGPRRRSAICVCVVMVWVLLPTSSFGEIVGELEQLEHLHDELDSREVWDIKIETVLIKMDQCAQADLVWERSNAQGLPFKTIFRREKVARRCWTGVQKRVTGVPPLDRYFELIQMMRNLRFAGIEAASALLEGRHAQRCAVLRGAIRQAATLDEVVERLSEEAVTEQHQLWLQHEKEFAARTIANHQLVVDERCLEDGS